MFNAGLIGLRAERASIVADAIALTDALLDVPVAPETVNRREMIGISEAFRIHGAEIAALDDYFLHYWKRSWKRYADWRLPRLLPADWNDLRLPDTVLTFNPLNVRLLSLHRSLKKRLGD